MRIITTDGKSYEVKYLQNKEEITNSFGTGSFEYPNWVGSKLLQNSTSSDIYSLTFAIHRSLFVGFKESLKKFVVNEADAVEDSQYGKLTNIVIEHSTWGAIKGKFTDSIKYNTSNEADIICSGIFQEHTEDVPIEKADIEQENSDAVDNLNDETTDNFDVSLGELDRSALLKLLDKLNALYANIQNSAVVSAFNDLNAELNKAILDSQKVMNATKKILALPGSIITNVRGKLDFFKKQAAAIKSIPVSSANLAKFNINCLAFNMSRGSRTPFISKAAQQAISGIRTVSLK
jgi:hypothetical protein